MINTNTHGSFLRNATISFLHLLNSESKFELVRNDQTTQINVPFFYNFGADEQFLRDFFFNLPTDCNIPLAEGNYEKIPRGVLTIQNVQVVTRDMTNKFVRGNYQAEERDENDRKIAVGHSARLFQIPLNITFSIEVQIDTMNLGFKIFEMFLDTFYANRVVYFQYRGLRIPAQFRFPDEAQINKNYTFDFATQHDNNSSVKLTAIMETYFPSFDKASDKKSKNVMEQINPAIKNSVSISQSNWIDQNTTP